MLKVHHVGTPSSYTDVGHGRPSSPSSCGSSIASGAMFRESSLSPRRSSTMIGPRSSTTARGLVAMGEGLRLKTGSASTFGAGPCLAVAVIHADGGVTRATLTHLQPEADVEAHADQIARFMPDNLSADMTVHISSAPGANAEQQAEQKARAEATVAALSDRYDYITLDFGDNVHIHSSDSLHVNADTGSVHTGPVRANFSEAELTDMQRRMEADPSKVQYFD